MEKSKKGTQLLVKGSLAYREYVDMHEVKREVAEIKVQYFLPLATPTQEKAALCADEGSRK